MSQLKLTADGGGGTVAIKGPTSTTGNNAFELTVPGTASGTILTSNSSLGKILQVVTVSDTVRDTTGTVSLSSANTYYDTPFAVTITPSATSSKILLMGHVMGEASADDYSIMWRIERAISGGSTTNIQASSAGSRPLGISIFPSGFYNGNSESTTTVANFAGLIDTPSTTSAITYTFQVNSTQINSATFYYNRTMGTSDGIDYERGLSWITAQEVAA
tara:strand:+ start:238 stop:891 length:654 start_codon:yes stop_codon:yes gene_type:complete